MAKKNQYISLSTEVNETPVSSNLHGKFTGEEQHSVLRAVCQRSVEPLLISKV